MSGPVGTPLPSTPAGSASRTDEELLHAAGHGDQESLTDLFDRHQGSMYGLALRITNDPTLAQDVVQEAFVAIWRNASRFEASRASGRTWMLSITHHRAIDAIRRRRPTVGLPEPELPPPAALTMPDIWDEVVGRLDGATVRAALTRLSDVQREAIDLAYFGGLTQQEVAQRTGAPLGTVKSRVRLGLLALRDELGRATHSEGPSS